jgi:DNA-binding CsgD family transcriptional regulator
MAEPDASRTPPPLLGREPELTACRELLAGVTRRGGALHLRGAPGIGKSALLRVARQEADALGFDVLATAGLESQAELPYAALQRLLEPLLATAATELPTHQHAALRAAFGQTDAAVEDVFLVGLAALTLLTAAAAQRPQLLVVDDTPWLDASTIAVLGFVVRRIEHDPIVVLAAGRDTADGAQAMDMPEQRLAPLDAGAARAVLDERAPRLSAVIRARVLAQAAGNPLALVELPLALRPEQRTAAAHVPELLPLTARLERAFAVRLQELSEPTRLALLAAAVAPVSTTGEILRAASAVAGAPVGLEALDPALAAGLVAEDPQRVRFRHPLVRTAVHQGADPALRRAVHAALARVTDDPQRRLWHRAEATTEPDEELAAALEQAGEHAQRRGSPQAAVATLERAAGLSVDVGARAHRLVRAAEIALEIGRVDDARRLVAEADRAAMAPADAARARVLAIVSDDSEPGDPGPTRELVALGDESAAAGDPDLALRLLSHASQRCWLADPGIGARREIVAAARRVAVTPTDVRVTAILAEASPIEESAAVVDRLAAGTDDGLDAGSAAMLGTAAYVVGEYERTVRLFDRAIRDHRANGRLALLTSALVVRGWACVDLGRWDEAARSAEQAARLAVDTAQPFWLCSTAILRSLLVGALGDRERQAALDAEAERLLHELGNTNHIGVLQIARGTAAAICGRYDEAFDHLLPVFDRKDPHFNLRHTYAVLVYFAAAAMKSGRREEGAARLAEIEPFVASTRSPALRAGFAHTVPILAGDDDEAEPLYLAALADPALAAPFDHARAQFAYGTWLRRRRRVVESRAPLRAARDISDRLGNVAFSERARGELRAAGEASVARAHAAWFALSPQESQIARLVAEGLTNREIGERLFLSPRTISSHLYRIFPKLGVTSRSQLALAVPDADDPEREA